jgi:hypothetical protein
LTRKDDMGKTICLDKHEMVIDRDVYERLKELSKTRNVFIDVRGGVASVNWEKSDNLVRVTIKDHDS